MKKVLLLLFIHICETINYTLILPYSALYIYISNHLFLNDSTHTFIRRIYNDVPAKFFNNRFAEWNTYVVLGNRPKSQGLPFFGV